MIQFLTKGLLRDRSRSLFPVIIITLTVSIVVFATGFMKGSMNGMFLDTAVIISGHEKVVTRAYKEESQMLRYKNFGRKSLTELVQKLGELNLKFGMDISQYLNAE